MDLVTLAAAKKYADKVAQKAGSPESVPTKVSQLENDSGFVNGKELTTAVTTVLTEAKENGDFKGDTGATGAKGADGADGKSAYQIWLSAGNTGDEAAFLESLKGSKGDTGKTGAAGNDGKKCYSHCPNS